MFHRNVRQHLEIFNWNVRQHSQIFNRNVRLRSDQKWQLWLMSIIQTLAWMSASIFHQCLILNKTLLLESWVTFSDKYEHLTFVYSAIVFQQKQRYEKNKTSLIHRKLRSGLWLISNPDSIIFQSFRHWLAAVFSSIILSNDSVRHVWVVFSPSTPTLPLLLLLLSLSLLLYKYCNHRLTIQYLCHFSLVFFRWFGELDFCKNFNKMNCK